MDASRLGSTKLLRDDEAELQVSHPSPSKSPTDPQSFRDLLPYYPYSGVLQPDGHDMHVRCVFLMLHKDFTKEKKEKKKKYVG